MEWYLLVLSICVSIIGYHAYKFLKLTKQHKVQQLQREYAFRKKNELNETYRQQFPNTQKKTNIFREMAIDQIAGQRLIYDRKSGQYVRRRQI